MHFSGFWPLIEDKLFLLCFLLFCLSSNSSGDRGVRGGEWSCAAEENAEQHPVLLSHSRFAPCLLLSKPPTSAQSLPQDMSHPNILRQLDVPVSMMFTVTQKSWGAAYLVLRTSRQEGRYLWNSTVRLAFSDSSSLLSIQLDTGGFQPRSAGFMYRMPGENTEVKICCWASQAPCKYSK